MKRKVALVALLVIAVVFAFPAAVVQAVPPSTVSGTVYGESGALAGATVLVEAIGKGGLPRRTALLTTDADGTWKFSGKAGDYRLTFSAEGYTTKVEPFAMPVSADVTFDVTLAKPLPPTGTIEGQIRSGSGVGMYGYVYFYKQNSDGTWPGSYSKQVTTTVDGVYTSGPLTLGTWKVRLFTIHTGVQWYRYAATIETATPIVLDAPGQVVTGIDAVYPAPAP